jgi:RNA polymerase sigma-70 factor (ECF subfamily)
MKDDAQPQDLAAAARRRRFEAVYAEHQARVLAYVLRRADSADDAADVIAETFLVAWRRLDDAPAGEEVRLWLYGVARRVLANHRRGERRRIQLADRLRDELARRPPIDVASGEVGQLAAAFRSLPDSDREVLALEGWEALDAGEIAVVLGCSRNAARIRLHRARRRLQAAIVTRHGPALGEEPSSGSGTASPARVAEPQGNEPPGARRPGHIRAADTIVTKGDMS